MTGQNEHQTVKDMCEIERQTERLGWETEKQNADVVLAETVKKLRTAIRRRYTAVNKTRAPRLCTHRPRRRDWGG